MRLRCCDKLQQVTQLVFTRASAQAGFQAILRKCLAFAPDERYRDAEQLLEDLEAERDHRPLKHAREPARSRLRKLAKRHPIATSNAAVVCLSLTTIGLCLLFAW